MAKTVGLVFDKSKNTCPCCGNEYQSEAALKRHIKEKHSDERTLQE